MNAIKTLSNNSIKWKLDGKDYHIKTTKNDTITIISTISQI